MTKDEFEAKVRVLNERYDARTTEIGNLIVDQKLSQVEGKEEIYRERLENWWAIRAVVNDYLYDLPTSFVYYERDAIYYDREVDNKEVSNG